METRVAPDSAAAAAVAADAICRRLRSAISRRGSATLAVSGGNTPKVMLARMATVDLPWHLVTVFQVDERVAPDGDPDRNANMLDALSSTAAHIELMPVTATDLRSAARRYAKKLPDRLDIVHLGIGDDGHTASWPPGDPVIDQTVPVAMSQVYMGRVRMTLTPSVVNGARFRLMLATGAVKSSPIARWVSGDRGLPVARVHRTGTLLVVDTQAAPATSPDR
ncbi:MAG: pgl pgi [Ilumatobacteraceae bacterium]|nr:pgl pgi [Ilumatobacteraceae bacterium]